MPQMGPTRLIGLSPQQRVQVVAGRLELIRAQIELDEVLQAEGVVGRQ